MLFISVSLRKASSHLVRGDADHGLSNMPLRRQGKRRTDQGVDWEKSTGMRARGHQSANDTEGHRAWSWVLSVSEEGDEGILVQLHG